METDNGLKSKNNWKELDLTAKFAQVNTLRKIAADTSFIRISAQLDEMVQLRIHNLTEDLIQLYKLDCPRSVELPKPE